MSVKSVKGAESTFCDSEITARSVHRQVSISDSVSEMDCLEDLGDNNQSVSTTLEVSCGNNNIKAWESDDKGELISWGCGEFGQHGHGGVGTDGNIGFDQGLLNWKTLSGTESPESCIKLIACGASHTVIVTYDNEIYSWGNGNSGQLGCGDRETHTEPQRVKLCDRPVKVKGVACGSRHTIVWLENGKCYSFGNNYNAQLGYDFKIKNYKENQVKPHLLRPLQHLHVNQVACGERHSIFLFDSGTAAGCGCNANGQIGVGSRDEVVTPKLVEGLDNIQYIACGAHHSMAVDGNGEVYVWGHAKPCGSRKHDVLTPQVKPIPGTQIYRVSGGTYHSLALSVNGTVYSWGKGSDGQLGHGQKVQFLACPRRLPRDVFHDTKVAEIVCGEQYSAALTVDASLYMWGRNSHTLYPDKPTSYKVYQPIQMNPDGCKLSKLSCGSWHAIAVTGIPDWKPSDNDTDLEELGEDEDEVKSTEIEKGDHVDVGDERSQQSDLETEIGSDQECPSDLSDEDCMDLPPEFMKYRSKTKLTLEQFYAPTPLPPELMTPLVTPRETTPIPDISPKRIHSQTSVDDVPKKSKTLLTDDGQSVINMDMVVEPSNDNESVNAIEMGLETAKLESNEEEIQEEPLKMWVIDMKEAKTPSNSESKSLPMPPKSSKPSMTRPGPPPNRPVNPYMTRSKTFHGEMPVMQTVQFSESAAEKFHLPREPTTLTNVDLAFDKNDKYVINKHMPIQLSKKKQSPQLPPENPPPHLNRPKRMNVLRGYSSFDDRDSYEQSFSYHKPNRPQMTRAHTFFGKATHSQVNPSPEHATKRNLGFTVEGKATCQRHESVTASPPAQKGRDESDSKKPPMFSSASSWRARKTTFEISKKILKS
ncbi:uncharacterized protein LOC144443553 isoform X2 [Glandiceps talaboti]